MATKQVTANNTIEGLETNPSLMSVKAGALSIGENITLNREGMAEGRRGFAYHTSHSAPIKSLIEYKESLLVHASDGSLSINTPPATTLTALPGSWEAFGGGALEGVDARGNLYVNRDTGIHKLPGLTGTARAAGLPPALDLSASLTGTGLGFLQGGFQVGYRVIFKTTDANGVIVTGAPCPQLVVANGNSYTLTSLTSSAGTATATTPTAHGLTTGDSVSIAGATPTNYNVSGASGPFTDPA